MSHVNKRVPKRRFMEFNNAVAWEQHKVLELGEIITGNTPSTTNKDYYKGQYLFVSPADIQDNRYVSKTNTTVTELGFKTGRFIRKGSILFVSIGSTIGKVGQADLDLITNQQINSIIPSNNYDDDFVYSNLLGISAKVKQLAAIQAVPIINKTELGKTLINNPSLEEQTKIGLFFKKLDNTITLHQRKLEKIKALKTAYLSEMFPAEGETEPKRRFAGFTDDWDQRKLGELAKIVRGASPRPIQDPKWFDNNSEVGWLRISDVTAQDGRINYLEQRISEAGQGKTRVLKEPHLLLSIAATVGKPVINYVKTGVHDGFLIFLDIKFEQEFLFQWLEMFRTSWQKYGQPGSQINLNSELVRNQEISIPSMNEQIKISKLFQQLDNAITLHQRKLQKLQNIKKAYLNEMFI